MNEFFNDFLVNQVIKPSGTVIKKMIEDKDFMKETSFESEVDAQMFPNPFFIYSLIRLLMKQSPEVFLETRDLLPNSLSALVGIAIAMTIRDPNDPKGPNRYLVASAKLLSMVTDDPSRYKYIEDLVNH